MLNITDVNPLQLEMLMLPRSGAGCHSWIDS